ncbi:MAG: hypothetical protein K9G41_11430, partial [Flavobacteriales bacterium]|nr:hypothetical protein [Flavobacteriales bacterium]
MPYLSQTLNEAAEGKTIALKLKYAPFLMATGVLLLPIPWLVVVIALTMLWVGIIGWTYKTAPAIWLTEKTDAAVLWLAVKIMKDERDSPYLYSYIGIGIIAPILFFGSYYIQVTYLGANESWGWKNWLAALAYNV